ncbi:hypothetical protein CRM22_005044 [Opisthorchis felineus]|uniref:Uncharacterized protein n=1 Tax=Opisthorchis felineus TaxID=147828 RepID=A0A4S2LT25_OPIFE|nr:hypothetical protein CRM22_005044 [Opisthorchis felineus]
MKTISFLDTSLLPTYFGYPAHFGPHCFLPEAEFRIVWRFLRCNRCSFRHLYHKLLLDENVRARFAASHCPANNAQPLHSLARAIKTILHGFSLNRHLPSRLVIASSGGEASHPISPDAYFTTVLQVSFRFQRKFVVCPSHGRELFSFLYCEDDSDSVSSVGLDSSLRTKIVPRGHSHFFKSCALHTNDQTTDGNDSKHVVTPIRVFAVAAKGMLATTLETHTYCNMTLNTWCNLIPSESVLFSEKTCLSRLEEINHRWNLAYQSTEVEEQTVFAAPASNRSVRFPAPNVVSKVHNLITYATASRLERRNRVWELEAQHRLFDRYRRLLSEGHDPSAATELSQTFTEEEEEITNCYTMYNSGNCSPPSGNHTECRPKKKRKRKRKRSSGTKSTNCIERNSCAPGLQSIQSRSPLLTNRLALR